MEFGFNLMIFLLMALELFNIFALFDGERNIRLQWQCCDSGDVFPSSSGEYRRE